jgi:hypothetical protein
VRLGEAKQAPVAARRGREPALDDDDAAGGRGDDGDGMGVTVRIDADDEVHFVCKHLSYLHDDGGNAGAGRATGNR